MARKDPRIQQVVDLLPADGSPISHAVWIASVDALGERGLRQFTQNARKSGDAIFEIGDMTDPAGSLTVRRAFIAAAPARPLPVQPRPPVANPGGTD